MNIDNITPGFAEKAKGKTAEEIVALAQQEGIELSDEQLEAISGGGVWSDDEPANTPPVCPFCRQSGTLEFRPDEVWCTNCFSSWKKRY